MLAHPRPESLNGHLFRAGTEALAEQRSVATSDLYAQGFDPVLGEQDLGRSADRPGNLAQLAGEAYREGRAETAVRAEHGKLARSELLVLQFPLWWYGPPAILKGWLDSLDAELGLPRRYGDGGLTRRRALVVVTVGEDARTLGPRGVSGDLDSLLFPLTHGALWYTGIETLDLHVVHDADGLDADGMRHETRRLTDRLARIDAEATRPFRRLRDGDYPADLRALHPDLAPGRTDLGIHRTSEDSPTR